MEKKTKTTLPTKKKTRARAKSTPKTTPETKPVTSKKVEKAAPTSSPIPDPLVIESLLLGDNEVILYTDENGEKHVLSNKPLDKNTRYRVLEISYEDISNGDPL